MGSADFSQFVVTTANGTACETSTHKVRALSLHVPAASTHTSSNFWTSSLHADLSVFLSLICGSCPSGQRFAYSFLQIPSHDGHPCCSAMRFVVAYVRSGLSPVRARPWRAYIKREHPLPGDALFHIKAEHLQCFPTLALTRSGIEGLQDISCTLSSRAPSRYANHTYQTARGQAKIAITA